MTHALSLVGPTTEGFSEAAQFIEEVRNKGRKRLKDSVILGLDSAVFDELAGVAEECREPNWDGYGAEPVSQETYQIAFRFLEAFPLGSLAPSVGADPDGQLTLEWHRSPRRTLSVSVSADGELHYAALLGPSKSYGTEQFFDEVPQVILDLVRRVYGT